MRDVAAGAFAVTRRIAESLGEDYAELCSGLVDPAEAEVRGCDWGVLCGVLERLEECVGANAVIARSAEILYAPEVGMQMRVLRLFTGMRGLYRANFRFGGPSLFRIVTTTFRILPDGRYEGTIRIPPPHADCPAFFRLCFGIFTALPLAVGLPDAEVELVLTPQVGTYLIRPPRFDSIFGRLKWMLRAMFQSQVLVEQLAAQNESLTISSREADLARSDAVAARARAEAALVVAEALRAEAEAAKALALDALRAKSDFVSTVSHELRTPMNGILGKSSLLLDTPLSTDQRDFAETIVSSGQVLLRLINDLLDFSKMEAGHLALDPTPTELRPLVEQVVATAATRAAGRALDVVAWIWPEVPVEVQVDALRLRQVLTNLVDNAVKFTREGEVVVEVRVARPDPLVLAFAVRDTGIGVDEAQRTKIFQPFVQADGSTTRQYGGTGLGLSISTQLVRALGGEIALESIPGVGSTFSFEIALDATRPAPTAPLAGNVQIAARGALADALGAMARELGWTLVPAEGDVTVVDADRTPLSVASRAVAVARDGRARPGFVATLRKPVRRSDLAAALAMPALDGTPPLRVALHEPDALTRRIVTRMLARLGATLTDDASVAMAVVAVADPADLDAARQRWPDARIVALVDAGDGPRWRARGADAAVERPVDADRLAQAIGG